MAMEMADAGKKERAEVLLQDAMNWDLAALLK